MSVLRNGSPEGRREYHKHKKIDRILNGSISIVILAIIIVWHLFLH
jgi:hypothetical protein